MQVAAAPRVIVVAAHLVSVGEPFVAVGGKKPTDQLVSIAVRRSSLPGAGAAEEPAPAAAPLAGAARVALHIGLWVRQCSRWWSLPHCTGARNRFSAKAMTSQVPDCNERKPKHDGTEGSTATNSSRIRSPTSVDDSRSRHYRRRHILTAPEGRSRAGSTCVVSGALDILYLTSKLVQRRL